MALHDFSATFVGDGAVGKTCLLAVLKNEDFPTSYLPNIYESDTREVQINGKTYSIFLSDTSGQLDYEEIRAIAYTTSARQSKHSVICLCFALNNRVSFTNLEECWLPEINQKTPESSIILIGTKLDLREEGNPDHVSKEEAIQLQQNHKMTAYIECSALRNINVDQIYPKIISSNQPVKKWPCSLL